MFGEEFSPLDLDDPSDASEFALLNRAKTIAVMHGQLPPFWWEHLLFSLAEGARMSHITIPDVLVEVLLRPDNRGKNAIGRHEKR